MGKTSINRQSSGGGQDRKENVPENLGAQTRNSNDELEEKEECTSPGKDAQLIIRLGSAWTIGRPDNGLIWAHLGAIFRQFCREFPARIQSEFRPKCGPSWLSKHRELPDKQSARLLKGILKRAGAEPASGRTGKGTLGATCNSNSVEELS